MQCTVDFESGGIVVSAGGVARLAGVGAAVRPARLVDEEQRRPLPYLSGRHSRLLFQGLAQKVPLNIQGLIALRN